MASIQLLLLLWAALHPELQSNASSKVEILIAGISIKRLRASAWRRSMGPRAEQSAGPRETICAIFSTGQALLSNLVPQKLKTTKKSDDGEAKPGPGAGALTASLSLMFLFCFLIAYSLCWQGCSGSCWWKDAWKVLAPDFYQASSALWVRAGP